MVQYLRKLKPKDLRGRTCLLRLDFNTDDLWRVETSLPTIKFLTKYCRALVILSHKGRPEGVEKRLSLRSQAGNLSKLLKRLVVFVPHFRFEEIKQLVHSSPPGSIFLLENLRFLKEEEENNPVLAEHLASMGDLYVNDAFAVSHRANASVTAITKFIKSYAGFELESEIKNLSRIMKNPKKPLVVILGGLKIEDKLAVVKNLQCQASAFLIGGALTPRIIKKHKLINLVMPIDEKKEKGVMRDIGPKTIKIFAQKIKMAKTIFWNGPLGNINKKRFSGGTAAVARSVAANRKAFKVVGGGETVAFLKKIKLDKKINFVSTGGGALLDFLAGKKLPGIKALEK